MGRRHAASVTCVLNLKSLICGAGDFGLFEGDASTVFFEVQAQLSNHVAAILPAAAIGLACGLLGILFTVLNLKIMRLRDLFVSVSA